MAREEIRAAIVAAAEGARARNTAAIGRLCDRVTLTDYLPLTHAGAHGRVWTSALQTALNEHEIVVIPASEEVYWLDGTVVIPSNRCIEAAGATVCLVPEYPYVMLRNAHVADGTRAPIDVSLRDENISIKGGTWGECATSRGKRRLGADKDAFRGVQTCMLFGNLDRLTVTDATFSHATSFCLQVGDLTDGVFERLHFISCYADGLHVNGNCENLSIRDFSGHVGDDLVALNMYDWIHSSINYGPARNIYCENIISAPDSRAKMMRLQPGIFCYADGTLIDCSLRNVYIKHARGIFEYKLYFQSPRYRLGKKPEGEGAGSMDNVFFEDIEILAQRPRKGDAPWYPDESDPLRCHFGMFFANSDIGYLSLKDIRYHAGPEIGPSTHLIAVGPMSYRMGDEEVFDPYVSATLDTLDLENIFVNGIRATDPNDLIHVVEFHDVNADGFSSGRGKINRLLLDGREW
jgi:hypothetical protein